MSRKHRSHVVGVVGHKSRDNTHGVDTHYLKISQKIAEAEEESEKTLTSRQMTEEERKKYLTPGQ